MVYLTDTHCHLYLPALNATIKAVLEHARENNVQKMLVPAIDLITMEEALSLSQKHPGLIYPAAGIHPNYAGSIQPEEINILRSYLQAGGFIAVGEIGLDFYREFCPRDIQVQTFQKMLQLASEFNLPVCLHNRDADEEMIPILDDWIKHLRDIHSDLLTGPGVFHSFTGSEFIATWALKHHFMLGISGSVTYKKSNKLREVIKETPLASILLETDSPYLTPEPFRGKTNQPSNVRLIAEKIAEIKRIDFELIISQTSENARRLFKWDPL